MSSIESIPSMTHPWSRMRSSFVQPYNLDKINLTRALSCTEMKSSFNQVYGPKGSMECLTLVHDTSSLSTSPCSVELQCGFMIGAHSSIEGSSCVVRPKPQSVDSSPRVFGPLSLAVLSACRDSLSTTHVSQDPKTLMDWNSVSALPAFSNDHPLRNLERCPKPFSTFRFLQSLLLPARVPGELSSLVHYFCVTFRILPTTSFVKQPFESLSLPLPV